MMERVTSDHLVITHITEFIERHGYALLFSWVLAEQGAIPLPSIPLLVTAGALVRLGKLQLLPAVACCVCGALIADSVWFHLGRLRGQRVLKFLCRVALEPDSCVRQTEGAFLKYGLKSLLLSKFVPGLNAVASPLAGSSGARYGRFLAYDGFGSVIWSGTYLVLGFVFFEQLESVLGYAARMGTSLLILIVSLFALWIVWKFVQRRRFIKQLNIDRITPEELRDRLEAGEELLILDLRTGAGGDHTTIPGSVRVSTEDLQSDVQSIPRDRDIILFCS